MNSKIAWRKYERDVGDLRHQPLGRPDAVPNGSFEEGGGESPQGWQLVHGELGPSTEWQVSGGVDGGRCLRISPKGGGASWHSVPIPVAGGAEYLFSCAMKRDGNRHWAHACEVSWVSLVFHDASGEPCRNTDESTRPFVIVRCRKTDNWVRGWRYLRAPRQARTLDIGFRITRGHPDLNDPYGFRRFWHGDIDTGEWWVDDVRLERMPYIPLNPPSKGDSIEPNPPSKVDSLKVTPGKGELLLDIPEGGARLRVVDERGEAWMPLGCITYDGRRAGASPLQASFHALREQVRIPVPPGRYFVEGMRGFQRKPFTEEVSVSEGRTAPVKVELPRVMDLPAQGWYEGDHHNHLSFHGDTRHPLMSINDVCEVARGEGLDYLSFCGEIVDQHSYADWRDAGRPEDAQPDGVVEKKDFVCSVSHEVTQDLLGHMCLVNAPGRLKPGHPWWITPTNAEIIERLRKGECGTLGATVMAHPYDGLTEETLLDVLADPERTGLGRELPVDAALDLADTMDFIVPGHSMADLDLRFRDYVRLLNLGFRIGVSASSDAYADQGTEIVGSVRSLVQADGFTMNAIAQGYHRRKTIATNGPVLMLSANGQAIGDTVHGRGVRVVSRAYSNWAVSRLEVIAGGETIAEATPGADGWAIIDQEMSFDRSQWLVARVSGPAHPALNVVTAPESQRATHGQYAITSPIFISVPGKPIVPRLEDAQYFIRWIDACCEAIRKRRDILQGKGPYGPLMKDSHIAAALKLFHQARCVYERLLA